MLCSTRNLNNTSSIAEASKQLGTALPTPNTQVRRDASGGVSVATLTASAIESNADTLNIATANNTQTVNLGSGTGVQTINIGNSGAGATTINIGGVGDSVNVAGTLTNINSTTTNVLDKTFVLNSGGLVSSAGSSGIYFEEAGDSSSSYMRVASDRTKFELKAPAGSLISMNQSLLTSDAPTFSNLLVKGPSNQIKVYPATDNLETSMVFNNLTTGGTGWILGQNIFSIGTGIFGIGGGSTGVVLKADPSSGLVTLTKAASCLGDFSASGIVNLTKNIAFPNIDTRKRIAIFDDGTPSDQTDHRFNGIGKGSFMQLYQLKTTAESHVFYAATSATTSNELFRIAGTGAVSCGGDFSASGIVNLTKNIAFPNVDTRKRFAMYDAGSATDNTQHNFDGIGKGALCVVYQVNSTSNNHIFYAATSSTASNELFRIAGTGAVSCGGPLSAGSVTAGTLTSTGNANITGTLTAGTITTAGLTSTAGATLTGAVSVNGTCSLNAGVVVTGSASVQYGVNCGTVTSTSSLNGVSLSVTGNAAASTLTANSLILPNGTLSYYEEYSGSLSFTGAGNITTNYNIVRTNNLVTISFWEGGLIASSANTILTATAAIPSRFYNASGIGPLRPAGIIPMNCSGSIQYPACIAIVDRLTGIMTIGYPGPSSYFPAGIAVSFMNCCFTYRV